MTRTTILVALAVLVAAALPTAAADPVISRGIDTWTTIPEGTFADLERNPVPAGFFCPASEPFTGRIYFRGVPLAADDPRLGTTDTIIERLDDARFNRNRVAHTRVQVRALQLEGLETLKTACGEYHVRATLDGEQPITRMRIVRENANGGRFSAPISLNTKLIFTPVGDPDGAIEFFHPVTLRENPHNRWAYRDTVPNAKRLGELTVDTDWDGELDTVLPGTSNFQAGAGSLFGNKSSLTMHSDGHSVH